MQANPDKFQALVLGSNKIKKFTLACENGNSETLCDKVVKLLGITFDQDCICSRVSKQVNVLQCIENILDFNSRLVICKNLSDKLEKLQTRALRFVYQDLNSKTDDLLVLPRTGNHPYNSLGH